MIDGLVSLLTSESRDIEFNLICSSQAFFDLWSWFSKTYYQLIVDIKLSHVVFYLLLQVGIGVIFSGL